MDQVPRTEFPAKRKAGDTNIDLWVDGSIYPPNPQMGAPPLFSNLKSFLCFVGDGAAGLLGYAESLHSANELAVRCAELVSMVQSLNAKMQQLHSEFAVERVALMGGRA